MLGRTMVGGECPRCTGEIIPDEFEEDTCPDCGRFVIGICMECDEIIPYDSDECSECGLDGCAVAYKWYREQYEPDIIAARNSGGPEKLANLLFKAWYDAGSLPDYDVMGDMDREMMVLYREHQMYDRLVFQMCYDATNYEGGSPKSANEAMDLVKEIGRADLELYCYEQFQLDPLQETGSGRNYGSDCGNRSNDRCWRN